MEEVAMNDTLYNCCPGHREPDWGQFVGLEIECCATVFADGYAWTERVPLHEAECFTVFGHLRRGGCEALTDVTTRELAHQIAAIFSEKIGTPCMILDCCKSEDAYTKAPVPDSGDPEDPEDIEDEYL